MITFHSPLLYQIDALQRGKLSINEITLLVQEIIERQEVHYWGQNVYDLVVHFVGQRLCDFPPKSPYTWRVMQ